jgi:hypothetical protein
MEQKYPHIETFVNFAENIVDASSAEAKLHAKSRLTSVLGEESHGMQLPEKILLRIGIKYRITFNLDIDDGLVNGTCGVLKHIEFGPNKKYAILLFFDFGIKDIGRAARERFKKKAQREPGIALGINLDEWTPLYRNEQKMRDAANNWSVIRKQFVIAINEASTVHKCQGQTLDQVALNLNSKGLNRAAKYVAMSRVRKLDHLHMYGRDSIVDVKYKNLTEREQRKLYNDYLKNDRINQEIERLRLKAQFKNILPCLTVDNTKEKDSLERLNIMFYKFDIMDPIFMNVLRNDFAIQDANLSIVHGTSVQNTRMTLPQFDSSALKIQGKRDFLLLPDSDGADLSVETTYRLLYLDEEANFKTRAPLIELENAGILIGLLELHLSDRHIFHILYMSNESAEQKNNLKAWKRLVTLAERSK